MPLVMVPGRMKEFLQWVRDVTRSAELKFGSRASGTTTILPRTRSRGKTRRNTRRSRTKWTRRSSNDG